MIDWWASWRRPVAAFWGAFCATMGINALSNATELLASRFQASLTEISPATSLYLVAEISALPLIPLIISHVGTSRLLRVGLWGFLAGSILCLLAINLNMLLAGRVIQGFFGGLLATTPLLVMKSDVPEKKQPVAMLAAGVASGFAPIVGPLITSALDAGSVQLLFLVMSALTVFSLCVLPGKDDIPTRPDNSEDWPLPNIASLLLFSGGLGGMVWAVEHMQEWGGWSDQGFRLNIISSASAILFAAAHQWYKPKPLLPLTLLARPRYMGILFSSLMMGLIIYGFLYLVPYYLIRVHSAGVQTLFGVTLYASLPQLVWMPVVLYLRTRLSPYTLVMVGALVGGLSVWQLTGLGTDFGGSQWMLPQGLRAISIPMIVFPLGLLLIKLPSKEDSPGLTSLYGLFRTFGGVVGVSGLTAFTESKQSYYAQTIMMNPASDSLPSSTISQQAWLYAFNDTFMLVSFAMVIMVAYFAWVSWQHHEQSQKRKPS